MKKHIKRILPAFVVRLLKNIFLRLFFIYQFLSVKYIFQKNKRFDFLWKNRYPQLYDNTPLTNFDRHYVYHPAWAARLIKKINPKKHVDISSTINFCSIVSAFIPVEFYDYRPVDLYLSNLQCQKADLTKLLFSDNSIESISCMHTIEHIGLGRYGDPIDPDGDIKAISELKRVLAFGGNLLFVVPIGVNPMIRFNAHRIYSHKQILSYFSDLKLVEFSLISEISVGIIYNASESDVKKENYGCGCYWFTK